MVKGWLSNGSKWRCLVFNGMLRHSLVTLDGEQDFIFFTEPSYPGNLPSLFIFRDFFSLCPFNRGRARLQLFHTLLLLLQSKQGSMADLFEYSCLSSLFLSTFGGCISRIPWSCKNFSLWKIMESPWQEGITRLQVDKFLLSIKLNFIYF